VQFLKGQQQASIWKHKYIIFVMQCSVIGALRALPLTFLCSQQTDNIFNIAPLGHVPDQALEYGIEEDAGDRLHAILQAILDIISNLHQVVSNES
jgi:hypothetical protein